MTSGDRQNQSQQQQQLVAQPADDAQDGVPVARPKVLSARSEAALRELESVLKNAKPIRRNQQLAARRQDDDALGAETNLARP